MIKDVNWAVDPQRVQAFFAAQPGAQATEDGFYLEGCRVRLTAVPGTLLGKWPITRTRLCFEGEPDGVEEVYRRFFLAFLSAGG